MDIIEQILTDVKSNRLSVCEAKEQIKSLIRDELNEAIESITKYNF